MLQVLRLIKNVNHTLPVFRNNDDDDDELFLWHGYYGRVVLLTARTIVRDPHHCEFPRHREQGLNLRRT